MHRLWRLADVLLLFLMFLLPIVLLLGQSEGTAKRLTAMRGMMLDCPNESRGMTAGTSTTLT